MILSGIILSVAIALTPWSDDDNGHECRWVEVHLKVFKQCRISHTRPKFYWLCVAQKFEEGGGDPWHFYCTDLKIDADEFDINIENLHEANYENINIGSKHNCSF